MEFSELKIKEALESKYDQAKDIINNTDKLEKFLEQLEKKLKLIPVLGENLSAVPTMAELLLAYHKKQYDQIPTGSLIAIVAALIYFVSPIDLIPDSVPGIGYFDDAAVVALCLKLVHDDMDDFIAWRDGKKN